MTEHSEQATPGASAHRFCILGTAGHIDHGKSAIVKALSGVDPDRLPEEKARGMTIELGFARLPLPANEGREAAVVGIVDVPGHERFVRMMVAGATGIDVGMLVIAADDGVMPQTHEHFEILYLLGVQRGLVVINKADLVYAERIDQVRSQIAELVANSPLADWPIVVASARTGDGIDDIKHTVHGIVETLPQATSSDTFRMAIDRVFTIRGRGTVVTGSVLEGATKQGNALEVHPLGKACRVREVHSHGSSVQDVTEGQRAALNITGVEKEELSRGMEVATPGYLTPSRYIDARVRVLPRREKPLVSHVRVRISIGTADVFAIPVVVGASELYPGESAMVQFRLLEPIVAAYGQRFIVRTVAAQATIGGGIVVRPVAPRVRPRNKADQASLQRAESDDPFTRCEETLRVAGFTTPKALSLASQIGVRPSEAETLLEMMAQEGLLIDMPGGLKVHPGTIEIIERRAVSYLNRHHANQPTELGLQRDRFLTWIDKRSTKGFGKVICKRLLEAGTIREQGPYIAHKDFKEPMSPEDAAAMEKIVAELETAGFDPPEWAKLKATTSFSKPRLRMLEDIAKCDARLAPLAPGKWIAVSAVERAKDAVRRVGEGRRFKLAEVRDELQLTRRVVQPLLEYLDRIQFTRRMGDERVLQENGR